MIYILPAKIFSLPVVKSYPRHVCVVGRWQLPDPHHPLPVKHPAHALPTYHKYLPYYSTPRA